MANQNFLSQKKKNFVDKFQMNKKNSEHFRINASLQFNCNDRMIVQPSKLRDIKANFFGDELIRLENCNLYCIIKRPRLRITSKKIDQKDGKAGVHYYIEKNGVKMDGFFDLSELAEKNKIELSLTPHPAILVTPNGSKRGLEFPLDLYSLEFKGKCPEIKQFEILYIGKSLGRKNTKNSIQRLSSHSKFQEILEDINDNDPESQVFVKLIDFRHPKLMFITNPSLIQEYERDKEHRRVNFLSRNEIPRAEYISMIEAVMIDYFKPKYNDVFTDCSEDVSSFKIFKYLKVNNINSIFCIFDMLTDVEVFSPTIPSKSRHEFERETFSKESGFFQFFKKMG